MKDKKENIEQNWGLRSKITNYFSKNCISSNSREAAGVPGPQLDDLPGGGGVLGHQNESPHHTGVGVAVILEQHLTRSVIGGSAVTGAVGTNHKPPYSQLGTFHGGTATNFGTDRRH